MAFKRSAVRSRLAPFSNLGPDVSLDSGTVAALGRWVRELKKDKLTPATEMSAFIHAQGNPDREIEHFQGVEWVPGSLLFFRLEA